MSILGSADDESPATWLDEWQHLVSDSIVPFDLRIDAAPDFPGRIISRDFGALRLTEVGSPPGEAFRTPKLIRRFDLELCKVDVQVRGDLAVEQNGRQALLRPGDFSFVDLSRPLQIGVRAPRLHQNSTVVLVFPRSLLPLPPNDVAHLTAVHLSGQDGTGALIFSIARQMVRHLDDLAPTDGLRLSTTILDLLTTMLARRADRDSAVAPDTYQRALSYRIHAFIEERLGNPGLSPSVIAAAHHISLRYLYKLFEEQGTTVAGWIRARRLERCRQDLLNPALRGRSVGAIAARWGFTNPEHFSRLFRAAYQLPPREYRNLHHHTATSPS